MYGRWSLTSTSAKLLRLEQVTGRGTDLYEVQWLQENVHKQCTSEGKYVQSFLHLTKPINRTLTSPAVVGWPHFQCTCWHDISALPSCSWTSRLFCLPKPANSYSATELASHQWYSTGLLGQTHQHPGPRCFHSGVWTNMPQLTGVLLSVKYMQQLQRTVLTFKNTTHMKGSRIKVCKQYLCHLLIINVNVWWFYNTLCWMKAATVTPLAMLKFVAGFTRVSCATMQYKCYYMLQQTLTQSPSLQQPFTCSNIS